MASVPRGSASPQPAGPPVRDNAVTPRMIALMSEARMWTLVLAFFALMLAAFLGLVILGSMVQRLNMPISFKAFELAILGMLFLFYAVPAVLLFLASQRLSTFVASGKGQDLILALSAQRTLWIVLGAIGMLLGTLTTLKLAIAFLRASQLAGGL